MDAPNSYVEVRETTTGVVILVRDRAYKIKKAVTTAYLDFASPERREHALRRELELNRRMCPDVYLGLTSLVDPRDGTAEPVLVMARMPEDRRLSALIGSGQDLADALHGVAEAVSTLHQHAARGDRIAECATVGSVRGRWRRNLAELRELRPDPPWPGTLDRIGALAERFLAGRAELFHERIAEGRIVDGHGDLLADDIFLLPDGPRILDCLDFDDSLRHVDTIDDASFLAMDLEFLGREDLALSFLASMSSLSGDRPPTALVQHYIAYRAMVRAKVDAVRAQQGDADGARRLDRHLTLAEAHLRRAAIRLCLVGGLPGSGKTTLSMALAERTGAVVIASDRVRRELVAQGTLTGAAGVYRAGLYSPGSIDAVYAEMLARARRHLALGQSVILDATWADARHRRDAKTLGESASAALIGVCASAPLPVAVRRIATRTESLSDATEATAAAIAYGLDPWPESVSIDTDTAIDVSADAAMEVWRRSVGIGPSR